MMTNIAALLVLAVLSAPEANLDACNVVWDSPSRDSSGSMPLGNGDVALNVWVEEGGDLLFYISKSDAWDENCRLIKLGRVRVKLEPNPFRAGTPFRQELRLRQGEIALRGGAGEGAVELRVWVDANRPVIHVDASGGAPFAMEAALEMWRTEDRPLSNEEAGGAEGPSANDPPVSYADEVLDAQADCVVWRHSNRASIYPSTLKHQDLAELFDPANDPLMGRTFGGMIEGNGFKSKDRFTLAAPAATRHSVAIQVLTTQGETPDGWLAMLERQRAEARQVGLEQALKDHRAWWASFWDRSWIYASGPVSPKALKGASVRTATAADVTRGYALQRFINACAGRGAFPIKFNGSLFCVDAEIDGKTFNADYRRWGGAYWFQNTRLPYWSMPYAGDFDLMESLFAMFERARPFCEARTRAWYGHNGAFYPETMYFWGTYCNGGFGYGWDRDGLKPGQAKNPYIGRYWSGGIEWIALVLDRYAVSQDEAFLARYLPTANSILTFFNEHWDRGPDGKILFNNAQSLETWHAATDPLPEIAGLRYVLPRLLDLPGNLIKPYEEMWRRLQADLPAIPTGEKDGTKVLLPAREYSKKANVENPELYAVFPYRLYGVDKPGLDVALATWERRLHPGPGGWNQDPIQAAMLGLGETAAETTAKNFLTWHKGSRFCAFWGPNYDWIPDQDHGSVAMTALQRMVMQCEGRRIWLLPAWPAEWDVAFKLHAPMQTIVEGEFQNGKIIRLNVFPENRRAEVKILVGKD